MKASVAWVSSVLLAVACAAVEITPVVLAADKHPFNTEDYAAIHRAIAVAVSPDGKTILYEVLSDGTSGPVNKHDWHFIGASGENARKLELPEHFEPSGFTKEGTALYGIEPIGQLPQLALVPLAEGGPAQMP